MNICYKLSRKFINFFLIIISGRKIGEKTKNSWSKYIFVQGVLFKPNNSSNTERIKKRSKVGKSKNKVIW